jgi:hypothetical protein
MTTSKPAPLETDPGEQKDDNIDDMGRKPDGKPVEQPGSDGTQEKGKGAGKR